MDAQPVARAQLVSVHRLKRKCPVCGKPDNCAVTADGRSAFCRRVRSDRAGRGGWWHRLTGDHRLVVSVERTGVRASIARAPVVHRDGIYAPLLRKHLTLSDAHLAKLRVRGLSAAEIERRGYKSTPTRTQANEIAAALATCGLEGGPGFYRDGDRWRMVRCASCFFVPYRDEHGRIQAMQYRLDEPLGGKTKYLWLSSRDCSSGAPVHHANHHLLPDAEEVTVTEGALKADVIAHFTQAPVVGIAGVSTFGADFATHLRTIAPRVRSVVVAYDMDLLTKREVQAALEALTAQLERARFRVRVRTWPAQWKGFDDYLLAQLQRREVTAA